MTNEEPAAMYLSRWNHDFNCPEYVRPTSEWTIHLDKAQVFTFDEACLVLDRAREASSNHYDRAGIVAREEALRVERLTYDRR